MKHRLSVTVHWGLLLAVYWAILFASAMVSLTSGLSEDYLIVLLASGIPIYLIASNAIMRQYDATETTGTEATGSTGVIPFPTRSADEVRVDIARVAADARTPHLRKLG